MLSELDPYSDYISPEDLTKFTEAIEQEFGGVGIQVDFDEKERNILVMTPFPGSPAYKAGIRAGDRIVEVEGRPVKEFPEGQEIQTAVTLLKGKPGVKVTVGVKHPGRDEIETVTMVREIIQLDTVLGDTHRPDGTWDFMLDDEEKIGYIRITHFTRRTAAELRDALRTLKDNGMRALVLDLRFNPGGLLQAAIEVCDMFIEDGLIVSTEGRNVPAQKWSAKPFGTFREFPMAVLVNRYSASASEIVSACLQDHKRAAVVGERTYGKGSVQNVVELEGGSSALKLTTAAYHRPSGKNIHRFPGADESEEWGVIPDDGLALRFTNGELIEYQRMRQARDLPPQPDQEPMEIEFHDTQLEKAVDYVMSLLNKSDADDTPDSEAAPAAATGNEAPGPADNPVEGEKTAEEGARLDLPIEVPAVAVPKPGRHA